VKRLLVVKNKGTEFCLNVTEESEIIKNPIPILWFNDGIYGWLSTKIIKNELSIHQDISKGIRSLDRRYAIPIFALRFTWNQVQQLPKDIGEILMAFAEEQK